MLSQLRPTRADLTSAPVVAGMLALVALMAVDIAAFRFAGAFGAAALVTSVLGRARQAVVLTLITDLCVVASGVWHGYLGTSEWFVRAAVATSICVMGIVSAYVRDERESHLARMTVIADTAQRALLRAAPESIGSVGLATRYVSASAGAHVGGDLYEVAATPYGVRVIVGDVCGKGLDAVQTAAAVLGAFRQAAFTEPDLATLARGIDQMVAREPGEELFVTAVVGEFGDGTVQLANCGHPAPLMIDGTPHTLDDADVALPLGLGAQPVVSRHPWTPGARLLFYTDGLIEQRDRSGAFFPLHEHAPILAEGTPSEALESLVGSLRRHGGGRICDDLALVLAENRA